MYGNQNYTFVYGKVKFGFLDTNGHEYNFNGQVPDLAREFSARVRLDLKGSKSYSNSNRIIGYLMRELF
jgi:hypothetical protein